MKATVKILNLCLFFILSACANESANTNESEADVTVQELNTVSIGGTANLESIVGLNCQITDPPLVQTVQLSLNLRQNMDLTLIKGTDEVVGLKLGKQNNEIRILNSVVVQSQSTLVGVQTESEVMVTLTVGENGSNKYLLEFQNGNNLEIQKNIDTQGNASYEKIVANNSSSTESYSAVDCEEFATLEQIMTKINANPMLDPRINGPQ